MGAPSGNDIPMYNVGVFPKVYGGTYPAMIFADFMKQFLAGQTVVDFAAPDRVPNQRAPKYLSIDGELQPSEARRPDQNGPNNANPNPNPGNDGPAISIPQRPVATIPDPVFPQIPVVTIPAFP